MEHFTDMHCHILPGVDDGARDMDESLAALDEYIRQGVTEIIVTPHFHPGRYLVTSDVTLKVLDQLREACAQTGRDVILYPGQECYYYSGLIEQLNARRALTMCWSRYVLVEFEPEVLYTEMEAGLRSLQQAGYRPILAHFERYETLRGNPERLIHLRSMGVKLQVNYDRLAEKDRLFARNPYRQYFRDGLIDYLGSDCHGTHYRPVHFEDAWAWMKTQDTGRCEEILHKNFREIFRQG